MILWLSFHLRSILNCLEWSSLRNSGDRVVWEFDVGKIIIHVSITYQFQSNKLYNNCKYKNSQEISNSLMYLISRSLWLPVKLMSWVYECSLTNSSRYCFLKWKLLKTTFWKRSRLVSITVRIAVDWVSLRSLHSEKQR